MQLPVELIAACLVQLRSRDGEFLGTGFFAAPRIVLTCAHVVWDAGPDIQVTWNGEDFPAEISCQIPEAPGSGELYDLPDLASVRVTDIASHACVWLSALNPQRHSQLTGIGYRSMRGLPGPPESGVGLDSVALTVNGPSGGDGCLSVRGDGIVAGLSGSPVLDESTGRVCGLLKARRADSDAVGGWVIPVETIERYLPEVVSANQSGHPPGGAWRDAVTDRGRWTARLFDQQLSAGTPRPGNPPPSWWLNARNAVVPFRKSQVFDDLLAWCHTSQSDIAPVRVMAAPGGTGKTRTGIELCRSLQRQGWVSGLVHPDLQADAVTRSLQGAVEEQHPVFMIIDYAEGMIDKVANLLDALPGLMGGQVRILLLARSSQGWLDAVLRKTAAGYLVDSRPLLLPDIGAADPAEIMAEAVHAFRASMNSEVAGIPAQVQEAARRHQRALDLHALALDIVLSEAADIKPGSTNADPISAVLNHERRYWERAARSMADVRFAAADELSDRALVVPTLYPEALAVKAEVVLSRVDGLQTRTGGRVDLLARTLRAIYPGERSSAWAALQPDRLAESLVRDVLAGFADTASAGSYLSALLADVTPRQAAAAVTVLGRLAGLSGSSPDSRVAHIALSSLGSLIESRPHAFMPAVVASSASSRDPGFAVRLVLEHVQSVGLLTVQAAQSRLPYGYGVVADLTTLAVALSGRAISLIQQRLSSVERAPADDPLGRAEVAGLPVELARQWLNLHDALKAAGQLETAEQAGQRACRLLLALSRPARPDLERDLAVAQEGLGQTVARIGRFGDGVALLQESITRFRALQRPDNPRTANDLARALGNLAVWLPDVNRRAEAVAAAREALSIRTRLAADDPLYTVPLIHSLHRLATELGNAGQFDEALVLSTQARERVVELGPRNASPEPELLAVVTHDHGIWLAQVGRITEAVAMAGEAVHCYEVLSDYHPEPYRHQLAMALLSLSSRNSEANDPWSALSTNDRALEILRSSVTEDSMREQLYAAALTSRITLYRHVGDYQSAIETGRLAVDVCRQLASRDDTANHRFLVQALTEVAHTLSDSGTFPEAINIAGEASAIQGRHLRRDVASSMVAYARATEILRYCWMLQGEYDDALQASIQVGTIYRELYLASPSNYAVDFAAALTNEAMHYRIKQNGGKALEAASEAVAVIDQLSEDTRHVLQDQHAAALQELCLSGSMAGQQGMAREAGERAVRIRRERAHSDPAQLESLARALTALAHPVGHLNTPEAIALGREAVATLRRFASGGGQPNPASLPNALRDLSIDLEAANDFNAAAGMSQEAIGIVRRLTAGNPAYVSELIAVLTIHARQLFAAGRREAAERAVDEANKLEASAGER